MLSRACIIIVRARLTLSVEPLLPDGSLEGSFFLLLVLLLSPHS